MEALLAGRRIDHHGLYLIAFMQWRRFRVASGGGGGGRKQPSSFGHSSGERKLATVA